MSSTPISPENYPKVGDYYYHFKHDHTKDTQDYVYKIIGIGLHTETKELLVVYKPLYAKNHIQEVGANFSVRPLAMFLENVDKPELNYSGPRFIKIFDPEVINKLEEISLNKN